MRYLAFTAVLFFAAMLVLHSRLEKIEPATLPIYIPPPQYISYLHFGYADLMADSLWLRAIQDFDYCGNYAGMAQDLIRPESAILADETKKKSKELSPEFDHLIRAITLQNRGLKVCKSGWVWQMLDATTELAPQFRAVYLMGGTSLSVVLNDYDGASKLFEKGVKQFPEDWKLPYYAAYHFMYDVQDLARAAELLHAAAEKGAPHWVTSLAARAYTASGQGELAIRMLLEFREHTRGELRDEVDKRIERIKKALVQTK